MSCHGMVSNSRDIWELQHETTNAEVHFSDVASDHPSLARDETAGHTNRMACLHTSREQLDNRLVWFRG